MFASFSSSLHTIMLHVDLGLSTDLRVAVAFFAGFACVCLILCRPSGRLPFPPYVKASMLENLIASAVQKSLFQLQRCREFANDIGSCAFGGGEFGSTFCMRFPCAGHVIVTTDYILARAVLSGEASLNISENERSHISKRVSFLVRNEGNILTLPTSDLQRHKTRKDIAPAFSSGNLLQSWPHIRTVIADQLERLRAFSASNEIIDGKSTIVVFFMQTLARGAFGVSFTIYGSEDDTCINGLAYLNAMDVAARERARQAMFPLRRFMFWEEGVQRSDVAQKELHRAAIKILKLHNAKQDQLPSTAHVKSVSILDHIVQHAYRKEITRLSDVTLFGFAGIDTTSYTFCFLLMELARNRDVRLRLQQELAQFMPPLSHDGVAPDSAFSSDSAMLSAISGCEFLSCCVREIMRLWPVAASGPARDLVQDIEYNEMLLPKGSLVITHFYSMFRERWINQPDAFLPDRWNESNPQLPQLKQMLIPFSVGRRSCMGQNMAIFQLKIVAAHFFHYFEFELVGEPTYEFFLTLKPDELKLRVHARE